MDKVTKEYVNAKITEDTRDALRKLAVVTGETFNSLIRRLAVQEYNRLSLSGALPKTLKEPELEYRTKRHTKQEK